MFWRVTHRKMRRYCTTEHCFLRSRGDSHHDHTSLYHCHDTDRTRRRTRTTSTATSLLRKRTKRTRKKRYTTVYHIIPYITPHVGITPGSSLGRRRKTRCGSQIFSYIAAIARLISQLSPQSVSDEQSRTAWLLRGTFDVRVLPSPFLSPPLPDTGNK